MKNIPISILIILLISIQCSADVKNHLKLEQSLMVAEMHSFGLESIIFDMKDNFKSRKTVYNFFRQGFGPSISKVLTDNIWNDNQVQLNPGDKIMESPQKVEFLSISETNTTIQFETPEFRKHIWGNSKITTLIFKKENDKWKLFRKKESDDNN